MKDRKDKIIIYKNASHNVNILSCKLYKNAPNLDNFGWSSAWIFFTVRDTSTFIWNNLALNLYLFN